METGEQSLRRLADAVSLGVLARWVPRDEIDTAVTVTGKKARRKDGKLPPHVMVYFTMAMALFADEDYEQVLARLTETLASWPDCWDTAPAPEVAAAIRAIYQGKRQVPLPVRIRDELGEIFADEAFAVAFGSEGRPGWSPGRLALVTVLQRVGNLTDRQAAEAVTTDLTWKYALGLSLDDPGFDASVLSEFRSRVIAHELEEKPLDLLSWPRCRSAVLCGRAASSAPIPPT